MHTVGLHTQELSAPCRFDHSTAPTWHTREAVVVLPTPGGPESSAALKLEPSSLLESLPNFAAGEKKFQSINTPHLLDTPEQQESFLNRPGPSRAERACGPTALPKAHELQATVPMRTAASCLSLLGGERSHWCLSLSGLQAFRPWTGHSFCPVSHTAPAPSCLPESSHPLP